MSRRLPRMTLRDALRECERLGIPVRRGKGDHLLVCARPGPWITLRSVSMNSIVTPRLHRVLRDAEPPTATHTKDKP